MVTTIDHYKKIIIPIITKHMPHVKIILYGSRARQDSTEGSDIDIALVAEKQIDQTMLSKILETLEESNLPIFFDIVDFHAVPEQLQKEIIKDGVIWKE